MKKFLLSTWLAACLAVLAITIYAGRTSPNDIGLFFLAAMIVLTFPSGLIVIGIIALLASFAQGVLDAVPAALGWPLTWILMVSLGYVQWFIAVPMVVARLRRQQGGESRLKAS